MDDQVPSRPHNILAIPGWAGEQEFTGPTLITFRSLFSSLSSQDGCLPFIPWFSVFCCLFTAGRGQSPCSTDPQLPWLNAAPTEKPAGTKPTAGDGRRGMLYESLIASGRHLGGLQAVLDCLKSKMSSRAMGDGTMQMIAYYILYI